MSPYVKEKLNHQAYRDVLDLKDPSSPDNEHYMSCYRFWKGAQRDLDEIDFYEDRPL